MLIDKLVKQVNALDLDLRGRTVLTEAANGAYSVTPVLAALSGARVYAFAKESRYGTVREVFEATMKVADRFTGKKLDITYMDSLTGDIIAQADIITNSGHLRPLDREKLRHARDGLVIPLMYEAWEWRDEDLDLGYVRERGFKIGATNERHPDIDVFNYLGDMALKQVFDAGICPYRNKFVLFCNNDFGPFIARVLSVVCDGLAIIDKDENLPLYEGIRMDWMGGFPEFNIPDEYRDAEAVIFTAYPFDQVWIGENAPIHAGFIKEKMNDPYILRFAGDVDTAVLKNAGIAYFPEKVGSGHMGILPSAIGYDPIIRLQSGGLKVGEALLSGKHSYNGIKILDLI